MTLVGVAAGQFLTSPARSESTIESSSDAMITNFSSAASPGAIARLEQRVQRRPNDLAALRELALAYTAQAATGNPAYYDLAARSIARAERIDASDDLTRIVRATLQLSLHQFDQAYRLAHDVHARKPDLLAADAVLVDATIELGKYQEAETILQRFVDTRASLASYARVSYLRELHGDVDGAIVAMQLAMNSGQRGSTELATVTSLLGDLELGRGRSAAARAAYADALRLVPELPLARLGLAKADAFEGRSTQAIQQLREFTARYPLPAAVALLGDLQASLGDSQAATESWKLVDAIAATQQASGQVVDLEMALFDLDHDRVAKGVVLAQRAYAARPDNVFAADVLAWARYRQARFAEAEAMSAKALRLGSVDASMNFHAAAIAERLGKRTEAAQMLATSLHSNPHFNFAVEREANELATRLGIRTAVTGTRSR